ncbi:VIT1/CCC1 transporter family protein [Microlunatus flavus]|uniref:Predicted Fe2+/Mn2+ transporter, VIT1/CCC1 family n=1 Tax=Microlunatus flavus TaxID=1036181 RepID=A0A1H9K9Z8_9ACTN|nr:VIT family protein [Microlunatus flavus]SEQ95939.1 Predicted Fe2+/Mn2+ transporter, VIT1/CCC1 family [Microlunatus flavus]
MPDELTAADAPGGHADEPHATTGLSRQLNWLRAGVLGANDGIVSVAAVVIGVAGAGASTHTLVASGTAALVGGALSMALGEYVSVSSQRDAQTTLIAKERAELAEEPEAELDELTGLYQERGLSYETARQVAVELTAHDALGAHLAAELNLSEDDVVSAGQAAAASAAAFLTGGLLPFLAIVLLPDAVRVPLTFVAVLLALAVTGFASARFNSTPTLRPTLRLVVGGAVALAATFAIGSALGTTVGG